MDSIGCAQSLIEAGSPHQHVRVWDGSRFLTVADFSALESSTKYPFALTVPQTVTESILGKYVQSCGIPVHRPFRVTGMHPNEHDPNYSTVLFENGHAIRARYVIGADGARSAVSEPVV